jgi:SPP1 family predicted phage head-tail adaptor
MRKTELPGRELEIADRLTFVQKTVFRGRYRSDLTTEDQAVCEGKKYEIISITEPEGTRRQFIDVVCNLIDTET